MGFLALTALLAPVLLIPLAITIWGWLQVGKKRNRSLFSALINGPASQALLICGLLLTLLGELLRRGLVAAGNSGGFAFPLLGVIFFTAGIIYSTRSLPRPIKNALQAIGSGLDVSNTQVIYLLSAVLFGMLAAMAAGPGQMMRAPAVAVVAWGVAMGLALLGAWQMGEKAPKISWKAVAILAALVVVALGMRAWNTALIPNNLTGDEASGGLFAVDILNGKFNNIFGYGWYSFPAFYFYFQALSIAIFGQTAEALRLTSALAGALTVGVVYLAGRALYGQRAGLLAAILLAGLHFHIHFSRIGLNNIWDGFWFTLVIGLIWIAWSRQRRWAFLLAGLCIGLAQYFYASGRMLIVLVPAWLLLAALADRARFKRNHASVILMFLVVLVVFYPLLVNYLADLDQFAAPMQRVSLLGPWLENEQQITGLPGWQILGSQLWVSVQAFTNTNLRHWYTPEAPILLPAPAAFFLLGLVLMILQWRRPQHWLIVLWLAAFTVAGGLSESTPAAQRYIGAAPAAALVIGFSLNQISKHLAALWKPAKAGLAAGAIAVAVIIAAANVNFYFWDFTPRGEYSSDNTAVAQHLANYLRGKPPGTQVAFFGQPRMGYRSIATIPFLAPQAIGLDMQLPVDAADNPDLTPGPTVFVFLPENEVGIEELRAAYPQAAAKGEYGLQHRLLYWYVEIAAYTPQ
ncbi:MAG: glycosyltransferase family 39 protein [Anaerolineales bacterium]